MRNLIFILLFLSAIIFDAEAQFREQGPKGDALRYNGWLQKQHRFKGYRPSNKELRILGKKPSEVRRNVKKNNKSTTLNTTNYETPNRITRSAIRINHGHNHSSGYRISPEGQNLGTAFQINHTARRDREFSLCHTSGSLNPNSAERASVLRQDRGYHFTPERSTGIHYRSHQARHGYHQGSTGQVREILPNGIS